MQDKQHDRQDCFRMGTPRCGLLMGLLGAAVAFMLLFLGFWRTLLVAVLFAAGYALGAYQNKGEILKNWINKLFPPKGE
ncbi:MAG: DUF2273 domain-containing protein [Clostridia bacterium]